MKTKPKKAKLCRHCNERLCHRSRGLCWRCYHAPGVRELYPPRAKACPTPSFSGAAPLPAEPTTALPGTLDRFAVLAARVARGEQLHHPGDAKADLS